MAKKQRQSVQKREREQQKRQREHKKAEKAALKRERRAGRGASISTGPSAPLDDEVTPAPGPA